MYLSRASAIVIRVVMLAQALFTLGICMCDLLLGAPKVGAYRC